MGVGAVVAVGRGVAVMPGVSVADGALVTVSVGTSGGALVQAPNKPISTNSGSNQDDDGFTLITRRL